MAHEGDAYFGWLVVGAIILFIVVCAAVGGAQDADDGSLACDPNAAQTACVSGVER